MVQRKKIRVYLRERILRLPLNLKKYSIFWKIKLFLKRLAGRELWLTEDVKLKTRFHGDWEYYPDYLNKDSVIYSLGVGDSIDFDIGLINDHDSNVHAFDPTPYSVDWIEHQNIPSKLVFHPWAVSSKDGSMKMMQRVNKTGKISDVMWTEVTNDSISEETIEVPVYSMPSIMRMLNHSSIALLKIDVEGTEYEIIENILHHNILPQQILVEFHHRFDGKTLKLTQDALTNLQNSGYKIFSISETGREVGFIRPNQLYCN